MKENVEEFMLITVRPEGGQSRTDQSTAAELSFSFQLSHDVLVHVCLAVIGRHKGAQPGYRERMAEHHLHIHPF